MGETWMRHRGQWEGQDHPNSFESLRQSYKNGMEVDVLLLKDGTLAVIHPADFKTTDQRIEDLTREELERMRVPGKETSEHGGAIPLFREFITSAHDRGLEVMFEVKGSSPDMAARTMNKMIEEISVLRTEEAFKEDPEYIDRLVSLASFSIEAVQEGQKAKEAYHTPVALGLIWSSTPEWAKKSAISSTTVERAEGKEWEYAGADVAQELQCKSILYVPTDKIGQELINYVHEKGLEIHVGKISDEARAKQLLSWGVDKVFYEPLKK